MLVYYGAHICILRLMFYVARSSILRHFKCVIFALSQNVCICLILLCWCLDFSTCNIVLIGLSVFIYELILMPFLIDA